MTGMCFSGAARRSGGCRDAQRVDRRCRRSGL